MSVVSNAKWVAISQIARILSQLANIFVLARILLPSDYGIMGMATVVTNLALLLRDQGTAAALIQKEILLDRTITTVFWFNIFIGFVLAGLIIGGAPVAVKYFKHEELAGVLSCLAVVFPLGSYASAHQALLERNSQFKKLAIIEVFSSLSAMVAAIFAAYDGWGVYSLVVQAILMQLLSAFLIRAVSNWYPQGRPLFSEFKKILGFTGYMTGFQLVTYFLRNADSMVIGRLLGAVPLGIYSMAYRIMLLPVQNISWAASRALYPIMSRQQDSLADMGKLYLQTIVFIAFITAPLMAGMFALRESFVLLAFGKQWLAAADVLTWIAPVGFIQSITSTTGTVFMAQGRARLLMWMSCFSAATHVAAFVYGSRWGAVGVAEGYLVASVVTALPLLAIALSLVKHNLWHFTKAVWQPICMSMVVCYSVRYGFLEYSGVLGNVLHEFVLLVTVGVLIYFVLALIFMRKQCKMFMGRMKRADNA